MESNGIRYILLKYLTLTILFLLCHLVAKSGNDIIRGTACALEIKIKQHIKCEISQLTSSFISLNTKVSKCTNNMFVLTKIYVSY